MSEHEALAHSDYGGSKASIWMNCPGSVAFNRLYAPKAATSKYAEEGTMAHALAERCLREGDRTSFLYRNAPFTYEDHGVEKTVQNLTYETCQAVNAYLDAVFAELDASPDAELHIEEKFILPVPSAEGEVFGMNDALVYTPSKKRLAVFDYKHGVGVSVSSEDNAQLKFYAAGAALSHIDWPIAEVELFIVQPRAHDVEINGAVRPWVMMAGDLIEFAGEVDKAVAACKDAAEVIENPAMIPHTFLQAGAWCRWCPSAGVCPAKERQAMDAMGEDFAGVELPELMIDQLPEPASLDFERLRKVLAGIDLLMAWRAQVRDYAEARLLQGDDVPGFKLVQKIGRAKWIDDEREIAAFLEVVHGIDENDVRPRKLVTITEAERLLKSALPKDDFTAAKEQIRLRYTIKESSGLTMVEASDRRESVNPTAADFGSVVIDA